MGHPTLRRHKRMIRLSNGLDRRSPLGSLLRALHALEADRARLHKPLAKTLGTPSLVLPYALHETAVELTRLHRIVADRRRQIERAVMVAVVTDEPCLKVGLFRADDDWFTIRIARSGASPHWLASMHAATRDGTELDPGNDLDRFRAGVYGPRWTTYRMLTNALRWLTRQRVQMTGGSPDPASAKGGQS